MSAGSAPPCAGRSKAIAGPVGVMSFNPEVGRWFARHAPRIVARARRHRGRQEGRRRADRAAPRLVARAGRISSPTTFATCPRASPRRSAGAGLPVLTWTVRSDGRPRPGRGSCRPDHLRGDRHERRATRSSPGSATGVAELRRRRTGTAAPAPAIRSSATPSSRRSRNSGSAAGATGWQPVPIAIDGAGRPARRGHARLCEEPQPGRICLRSQLGGRLGAGRRRLLSQAADRGAVHAGAGPAAARRATRRSPRR